jgi:hypothetical protein
LSVLRTLEMDLRDYNTKVLNLLLIKVTNTPLHQQEGITVALNNFLIVDGMTDNDYQDKCLNSSLYEARGKSTKKD